MKLTRKINKKNKQNQCNKIGSALILTMFILTGMMIVAVTGSYVVSVSIKSSGVQSQSVKAYFVAEAGAERLLYELRQKDFKGANAISVEPVFSDSFKNNENYQVFHINIEPIIYHSLGEYNNSRRNVEIKI